MYIYILMYTYRLTGYSDFYLSLYLRCCVPPSSMEAFFLQKRLPKKLFMGEIFGKNLWRGLH